MKRVIKLERVVGRSEENVTRGMLNEQKGGKILVQVTVGGESDW